MPEMLGPCLNVPGRVPPIMRFTHSRRQNMGEVEETRKPDGNAADGREGDPVEGHPEDVSARDSLAGDIANKIDPDMGTPEEGADPVEPKSQAE
jgi:hypothetical protein